MFRNLYRDFLHECTHLLGSRHLRTGHNLYAEAAVLWTEVAALIAKAEAQYLVQAGAILGELSRIERDAMQSLSCLGR